MKYYKLVRVWDINNKERYFSFIVNHPCHGVACVEYFTDKFTSPPKSAWKKGYWLVCFDSLEKAKKWGGKSIIFEVETKGKIKEYKDLPPIGFSGIRLPWTCFSQGYKWPLGTVMAEKVRLSKKVWPK